MCVRWLENTATKLCSPPNDWVTKQVTNSALNVTFVLRTLETKKFVPLLLHILIWAPTFRKDIRFPSLFDEGTLKGNRLKFVKITSYKFPSHYFQPFSFISEIEAETMVTTRVCCVDWSWKITTVPLFSCRTEYRQPQLTSTDVTLSCCCTHEQWQSTQDNSKNYEWIDDR